MIKWDNINKYCWVQYLVHTLSTWCKELTHLKRSWFWERLRAGGEGDDRGWDGRLASPTQWTWVWVDSMSWWWTGRPGVLRFMGLQRVGHDWVTDWRPNKCKLLLKLLLLSFFPMWLRWWRILLQCGRPGSIPGLGRSLEKGKATYSSILA